MTASAEARETALLAAQAAADKLATDVSIVDVSDRLAITDAFVLASAPNERQVQSIVDEVEERLREHGMGVWEGLTRDEVGERYPDQLADWVAGRQVRGRGGEEPAAVADRAVAALADLPAAHVAVVVTHGGTAGRLVERLLGIDPEHRRVLGPLGNCAWSELSLHGDRWRLIRHNSSVLQLPPVDEAAPRPALRAVPAPADDEVADPDAGTPMTDADALN